jgi:hypothetical protein
LSLGEQKPQRPQSESTRQLPVPQKFGFESESELRQLQTTFPAQSESEEQAS